MTGELRSFRRRRLTPEEGKIAAERVLKVPIAARQGQLPELRLDDPETLLPLLDSLRRELESSPTNVLEEAAFLYGFLEHIEPHYPVDAFLLDEREYFLGETARVAGTASRELSRYDEAKRWLDLADAWFLLTENAAGNLAKVNYQRLALRTEERDFQAVSELLPRLIDGFERLGMAEDAIKARFLGAVVLRESDRIQEALELYRKIAVDASDIKNDNLLAWAHVNIVQLHGFLGDADSAREAAKVAIPLLQRTGNQIGLAKLQWGLGYLMRSCGDNPAAVEAFRKAQNEFASLRMRADVAAVNLVIADLFLDTGQEKQAEWEIRQALPIIDECKLVPEGFAALSLLRESLRRQKIDREALRNLHGYFEELQG
jgi:tetratricopeptide (TPR) repeat protein